MERKSLKSCESCSHELIHGVACDWQPENCRYHNISQKSVAYGSHKHNAWAASVAEENEYDAVKSFG